MNSPMGVPGFPAGKLGSPRCHCDGEDRAQLLLLDFELSELRHEGVFLKRTFKCNIYDRSFIRIGVQLLTRCGGKKIIGDSC